MEVTTTYKNCQSCGMPFRRDPEGGGTNADGSKNHMYCSHCYALGQFKNPEIDTAPKMMAFVREKLKSIGFPGLIANLFVKRIPSLKRWKT